MQDLVAELTAALPEGVITQGADVGPQYLGDWAFRDETVKPLALARPRGTEDVCAILRLCNAHGVPVVPQGGRTGLAGGAKPSDGWVVLSMERMRAVSAPDTASATVVAEAGAPLQTVQEAADKAGLLFPLDIGGRGTCTIGGNISTNAGGNRVLRYGMMRELVLGVEAVLADGTVLSSMNTMLKNNTGYDLKQLFVGGEGTLGVVTRAVLRLFPKPSNTQTALCAVADYEAVIALLGVAKAGLGPTLSAFEVMWPLFYKLGTDGGGGRRPPIPHGHGAYVLVESMGADEIRDQPQFQAFVEGALEAGVIADAVVAQSIKETQAIWDIRDSSGELRERFRPDAQFDVSLPVRDIGAFIDDCSARLVAKWSGAQIVWFGHAADSNVHIGVRVDGAQASEHDIDEVVYRCVGDYKGSISAEHGIGLLKRDFLNQSRSSDEIAVMRRVKQTLDPKGVMNPGKIFSLG